LKENDAPTENYIGYGFVSEYLYDEDEEQYNYVVDDKGFKINRIYPESPSYEAALLDFRQSFVRRFF